MAEIKDKLVNVEDLSALHEYNKLAYMPIDATAEDIGVYTKEEVNTAIQTATTAENIGVYTKEEVDAAIQTAIGDIMDTGF